MKKSLSLGLAVALLLVAAFTLIPGSTDALPRSEVDTLWVDAQGNIVGTSFRGCDGSRFDTGSTSNRERTVLTSCRTGISTTYCTLEGLTVNCSLLFT